MKQQLIVSVPDATDIDQLPAEMLELFALLGVDAPQGWTMPGTRTVSGRRLVHLITYAQPATIEWLLSMLNATASAGWIVEAAQDWRLTRDEDGNVTAGVYKAVPLSLLDYTADQYDESGNALPRPTEPVPLHSYSGADAWEWEV